DLSLRTPLLSGVWQSPPWSCRSTRSVYRTAGAYHPPLSSCLFYLHLSRTTLVNPSACPGRTVQGAGRCRQDDN
ncbi:MAG TPA: hypothetical protein VHO48_04020, partial [Anaerolineaceae bacterium]|nr:hypothetical protein [Anaerolineaceae bacterium]